VLCRRVSLLAAASSSISSTAGRISARYFVVARRRSSTGMMVKVYSMISIPAGNTAAARDTAAPPHTGGSIALNRQAALNAVCGLGQQPQG